METVGVPASINSAGLIRVNSPSTLLGIVNPSLSEPILGSSLHLLHAAPNFVGITVETVGVEPTSKKWPLKLFTSLAHLFLTISSIKVSKNTTYRTLVLLHLINKRSLIKLHLGLGSAYEISPRENFIDLSLFPAKRESGLHKVKLKSVAKSLDTKTYLVNKTPQLCCKILCFGICI